MNFILPAIIFTLITSISHAQSLKGTVVDATTKQPLPYATVIILGTKTGGITEANGSFNIQLQGVTGNDTVKFSYLGYQTQSLLLTKVNSSEPLSVMLKPINYNLPETKITEKAKTVIVGERDVSQRFTGWGDIKSSRGRARGVLISPEDCNVRVKRFAIRINENSWDSVKFRLLMLSPELQNGERKSLLHENIFFTVAKTKNKWVTVDLSQYNIVLCDKFILATEWVDAWGQPNPITSYLLTITLAGNETQRYSKEAWQENGEFIKAKAPAMYLEVFK